jgi:flagellar motor protein MotB
MFEKRPVKRYEIRQRAVNLIFAGLMAAAFLSAGTALYADTPSSPFGADAVPDIYSPSLTGPGGFTTTTGGAPASALNPAQGGDAHRMIFDAGYLAIPVFPYGDEPNNGYMQSISVGALFPTRYGVYGGSLRYIGGFEENIFESFPINPTFSGNLFAAKEVYPGMSLGLGINFGFVSDPDWTLSGDLGFRYNTGDLGFLKNFTWAVVLRGMGKSYFPTWFTPAGGVSFDFIDVKGKDGKKDPLLVGIAADLSFPSFANMIFKAGMKITIAETIELSASWPGGSGLNVREMADPPKMKNGKEISFTKLPSVGLTFNFILPSGGERIAGGRLPSDGDLKIHSAFKPLYEGVTAIGGGVSWYVGVADKKPPVIDADYPETGWFSPNNDGNADFLEFPVSITDDYYVTSWVMEIKDEQDNVVRTIENKEQRFESFSLKEMFKRLGAAKKQIDVPPLLSWDGLRSSGEMAADGKYFFTITATDDSDNTSVSSVYEAVLRNTPPTISIQPIADAQKIFDPKAGGARSSVTFTPTGSDEEAWESGIWNASGVQVRKFETESGRPSARVWDGRNDSGEIAPDGVYSFRISTTDRAQNSASAETANIILDAREAGAFLTSSVSAIAPRPDQSAPLVNFAIRLLLQDGIESWKLELVGANGEAARAFSGGGQVPAAQSWNGLDEQGRIREGVFTPRLSVTYTRGDVVQAAATNVTVDVSGPEITFVNTPEYFSPDNDGEEDELFINITLRDASPIASWRLEIREPEPPYLLFRVFEGRGSPAGRLVWNGRSDKGELVQSATDYPYTLRTEDVLGNASSAEGKIGIDVLVIRDGDRLRIMIPSIEFRPNFADFDGLPQQTIDNNTRIIRRIAQILNKFRDYKVQVEGHANPTSPPGPARDREEPELKRISEARARAIVDQLARNGVARSRLFIFGAGGTSPVVPFEDRDNWWKNRRVEFILIK